ncbi:molybdenum cofactor guanylyltransferase [Bacillus pseudomycoides]|uniref:Probable molybdenum cofactor guanylyltransferase n=1 Tax=Bacillus pseudomycoides TaxID=64104 RepID=A0AAJ2DI58_9BACI|nr:molybdenum cofactor guanylyltransferase [Bacillus pseudomycoides]MBD5795123.1 molybdenum cofactor guanylyltransferase [Bacillus pseudomycoides]MCR8857502.1 molybdenum cofactor guanylyltransferase [Bacillus pseudomycoides]MDR4325149.1 molybdenum cofactor guanylyltransferase [Bacillus pseudomycoides]MED1473085.1 molybdenum cofactor guanylyltransferase [Bacillus pseudomycoides]MED1534809.1 molybdenum cofactor guanylyltransferase [Bacillus pseudomycoides]
MKKLAGIVLAGGMSRRFGEPKALASWQGHTFIEQIVQMMRDTIQNVVVISHPDIKERIVTLVDVPVIEDIPPYKGDGPLAGIVSGMEHIETEWYIVSPCDAPNLSNEWITALIGQISGEYEAIVPVIDGRKQPLLAAYHYRVKEKICVLLNEEKRSMGQLLSQCNVKYVMEEEWNVAKELFVNVNTKEEYARLLNEKKNKKV